MPLVPKTTNFYSHAFSVDTSIFQIELLTIFIFPSYVFFKFMVLIFMC